LPTFISSCRFGGMFTIRSMIRRVGSSRSGFGALAMASFTSKEDEAFFAAIGRLTISWAHIEAGIDGAVAIIHQCFGGKQIETDPPRTSLYRKLRYIRKWAKTVPVPIFQESAGVLMGEIEKAAELRHDIIHGYGAEGGRQRRGRDDPPYPRPNL
jgi:hypothetical protein